MSARPTDLLLVGPDDTGLETLGRGLESVGFQVDRVEDLGAVRRAFFAAGGHDAVIVGPGLSVSGIERAPGDLRPTLEALVRGVLGHHSRVRTPSTLTSD